MRARSPVSAFEAAVDAILSGDSARLKKLLRENPELVRARSTREHRSTLLHYVSANGVEDFRQKTPKNIVEITKLLLEAGADVNAESDAYGGRSTALGLTATSCHPDAAGGSSRSCNCSSTMGQSSTVPIVGARSMAACTTGGSKRLSSLRTAALGWTWKERPESAGSMSFRASLTTMAA